jgi:hypothetical protein
MSDQCKNCIVRGDYQKCLKTPCFRHESWIDKKRIEIISDLLEACKVITEAVPEYEAMIEVIKKAEGE